MGGAAVPEGSEGGAGAGEAAVEAGGVGAGRSGFAQLAVAAPTATIAPSVACLMRYFASPAAPLTCRSSSFGV